MKLYSLLQNLGKTGVLQVLPLAASLNTYLHTYIRSSYDAITYLGHLHQFLRWRGAYASKSTLQIYTVELGTHRKNVPWPYLPFTTHTDINQNNKSWQKAWACLNVSTTPLRQWGFRQCLPFSWTTLRDKLCWHPIAVMGVVDTFGLQEISFMHSTFDKLKFSF